MKKLTVSRVKNLPTTGKRYVAWDNEIKGFGVRVSDKGVKSFVLKYVNQFKKQKYHTIGKYGSISVPTARNIAEKLRGQISLGIDPQSDKRQKQEAMKVEELCKLYLKTGCDRKKASTIATDIGRINGHIIPLLGSKAVTSVKLSDVQKFQQDVTNGKTARTKRVSKHGISKITGGSGTARRAVGLLGAIFQFAIELHIIDKNPTSGLKKTSDKKCQRYLNNQEVDELAKTLTYFEYKGANIFAVNIIRLLLLTGCRRGEIENLKWSEVDLQNSLINFDDSKTGAKTIPISDSAKQIIENTSPLQDSQYVFPGRDVSKPYVGTPKVWLKIRNYANLDNVRLHDLRHTFASQGASSGIPIQVVGRLLGHKDISTTQQYANIFDEAALNATQSISKKFNI